MGLGDMNARGGPDKGRRWLSSGIRSRYHAGELATEHVDAERLTRQRFDDVFSLMPPVTPAMETIRLPQSIAQPSSAADSSLDSPALDNVSGGPVPTVPAPVVPVPVVPVPVVPVPVVPVPVVPVVAVPDIGRHRRPTSPRSPFLRGLFARLMALPVLAIAATVTLVVGRS
jgi:hypothetical protein